MSSLDPNLLIETVIGKLDSGSATDVYTVEIEEQVRLLSVVVTGSAGTCVVAIRRASTDYDLAPTGLALPSATENLEALGWPGILLKRGDSVRLTGASGHNYFVTYSPIRNTSLTAQR